MGSGADLTRRRLLSLPMTAGRVPGVSLFQPGFDAMPIGQRHIFAAGVPDIMQPEILAAAAGSTFHAVTP